MRECLYPELCKAAEWFYKNTSNWYSSFNY